MTEIVLRPGDGVKLRIEGGRGMSIRACDDGTLVVRVPLDEQPVTPPAATPETSTGVEHTGACPIEDVSEDAS